MLILLNKPFNVLCQFTDKSGRATLADYVDVPNVYPAGLLDFDSEGLVVLTDDGRLQARIADPRFKLAKRYWVQVEGEADEAALKRWYEQYAAFLNERSVNEKTGHSHYTHKRLRAAYNSLKRHLPWLFTCERFPNLGIPNTTNLLEGKFSEMKQLLQCHRGLKKETKLRFIKDYFSKK